MLKRRGVMDSSPESFQHQPSQVYPFDLYRSPQESTSTGPHQPGGSPAPYSILSPLLHPNSTSQRWSGYRQRQCLFSELAAHAEVGGEDGGVSERRGAAGGARVPHYRLGERGRGVASEPGDWSQDLTRVKRLRVDSMVRREGEMGREGHRGKGNIVPMAREDRSGDEGRRRKESREGRQQQRRELKLQFEETRGRLLELQRKVWRVYGEQQTEEEKRDGEGGEDGVIDEMEMFSEGEGDDHLIGELSPPLCSSAKNHECTLNGSSEVFSEAPVDLDVELNEGGVWLGCSLVQGEWESAGGSEKFAQALKKELASVVARVIDRVVRLYSADSVPVPAAALAQEPPTSKSLGPNSAKKPRPSTAANVLEQAEALPLVIKRPQDKRNLLPEGRAKNTLIPQSNPSLPLLPLLPQPPLPTLMPPRNKDPFLPSCAPNPPALPLPLLHYTMQQLFARSLSTMPLHKDGLSNEPFMEFRSHNLSFPPLPLLGQLNPPLADRGRDEGMRAGGVGGLDGGEAALFLGSGAEGLSPCHLKKAKLMFFYTRYPSSNTLKTYFPDVKFNRCVTSQLIKWFSNFREFFYIQMERFARQAAREGLATARERALHLSRNSELFRILNMHYNKSNDYQVPDRFVEVSELALREFFAAIQSGRDADPCWKKSIYKIICKLDSPVPDSFRLPGCPMDPHRMV